MNKFIESIDSETKKYFDILEPEFPEFLLEYIDAPELQRIHGISMFCGKDYSASFGVMYPISNLAHSVGVALIIWHFTHNKKQTLAGLFHDIATPVFKHCVDFMNGDAEKQESTEDKTEEIIKNSKYIMSLLKRDKILLEDVCDYKIYSLADSPSPRLSADRFEYTFSCGLSLSRVFNLDDVRKFYSHIEVCKNEFGKEEFAFDDLGVAEEYLEKISKLWPRWCDESNNVYMQFLADMCASANKIGKLTINDLYNFSEKEVLEKINTCGDRYLESRMRMFQTHTNIYVSDEPIKDCYCVKIKCKRRYISPLAKTRFRFERAEKISAKAKAIIDEFLNQKFDKFGCLDFEFTPYK